MGLNQVLLKLLDAPAHTCVEIESDYLRFGFDIYVFIGTDFNNFGDLILNNTFKY